MKKISFIVLLIIIILSCQDKQTNNDDAKNNHLIMATAWYQKSAEMDACYYQAFNLAEMALKNKINTDSSTKPNAIILDVDETLLDNSPFQVKMIETGKQYSHDFWKQWTDRAEAKAIPGAIEFLKYASDAGIEIFYISNRMENELESTISNMEKLDFPETSHEHFLLKSTTSDKKERRKQITQTYDVLLLVGDNLGDFSNRFDNREKDFGKNNVAQEKDKFGTDFIVLPNPMYGTWVNALQKQSDCEDDADFIKNLPKQLDTWE